MEPQHQGIAAMLAAFFLILGIFSGVCFSFLVVFFIENAGHLTPADGDGGGGVLNGTNITAAEPILMTTAAWPLPGL